MKLKNNTLNKEFFFSRVSLKDKAVFAGNLAIMIRAGLSITEALDILSDQARGRLKKIIQNIGNSIIAGNSLWSALSAFPKVFSGFFINAVKAGEASGNLENNLAGIADHLNKKSELISKIKGAMAYPLIILAMSFVLGISLAFFVLPKITPIFIGLKVDLPATTRGLIWFSGFIKSYGLAALSGLIAVVFSTIWLFRQKFVKPITHFVIFYLPIAKSISRHKNLALFSRTLATLLKSGLSIDQAMGISKDTVENYYYKKSLAEACKRVSQGVRLSDSLEKYVGYFPRLAIGLIRVGEKSGNLEEELFNLAEIYEQEVDNSVKTLSVAIEPLLLLIIGVIVGILALSIITPIYKITGNVYR